MILDFKFKDYICNYFTGDTYIQNVCFSLGYDNKVYNKYAHATYIWPKKEQTQLNYCFFDKTTLFKYFFKISKILGFNILSFSETKDSYKLQIKCIPDHRYFIYCSMCIRYVYEHPFALLLYTAWQNRHNFPELDIIQIMQFYVALFFNGTRCHVPGKDNLAFYNINSKCQFNIIKNRFNDHKSFYTINTRHNKLISALTIINTKQLYQITNGINFIANQYYAENKENICRW